ncbi:MAG: hypothetical protein OXH31_08050 [Gammaproteobacteria bacterium]|nr:hypothetical protein [Gammaproteobacteria bacterium]
MKKAIAISVILLTSGIVIGGGGTYLVHLATSAKDASMQSPTVVERSSTGELANVNDDDGKQEKMLPSDGQIPEVLRDSSLQNDTFQSKLEVYTYVSSLSEQQVSDELQRSMSLSNEASRRVLGELQIALLERLVFFNPVAAKEFALEQEELDAEFLTLDSWNSFQNSSPTTDTETVVMPLVQGVFKEWALSDLDTAINNAKSLNEDAKNNALVGILASLSGESLATYRKIAKQLGHEKQGFDSYVMSYHAASVDDPKDSWAKVINLIDADSYEQHQVLANIAVQWYEQDGIGVIEDINAGSLDESVKSSVVDAVLIAAAKVNPQEAFQYAQTLPSDGYFSRPMREVIRIWASTDPQAAFQAATSTAQSSQREYLQGTVLTVWASNDPYYVLENSETFPMQIRDEGIANAIEKIAQSSPQEAAELALEQGDGFMGALNFMLPTSVMLNWVRQDVEAAENWVFNGPIGEEKRDNWTRAFVSNLVHSDPRRAFELALEQPKAEGGLAAWLPALEVQIFDQIVYSDLDLAIELLPKVPEGESRASAYSSVAREYINLGNSDKAINLGLQLSSDEQANYFQNIAYTWSSIDPAGLVESFKNIPTPELRSSLAQEFTSGWMKENFTDAQLDVLKQYLGD